MTQPDTSFAGSIPAAYDRYLVPMIFRPYAVDLAARAARFGPKRILETACGTGILTEELGRILPADVELVATDFSEGMLEITRKKMAGDRRVSTRVVDASDLPYPDREFDLVICQFGVMFVPDKQRAFSEANRVLRTGGHLLLNVWDGFASNPLGGLPHQLMVETYPKDPPAFYQVPFSMHDQDAIRALARNAGLKDVRLELLPFTGTSPTARDAATGMLTGTPTISALRERGMEDPSPLIDRLAADFARIGGIAPFRVPMQAIVVTGSASA